MAIPTAIRTRPPISSPRSPTLVPSRSPSSSPARDEAHVEMLGQERREHGPDYQDHDVLFAWEDGTPPHPDTITRRFKELAAAAVRVQPGASPRLTPSRRVLCTNLVAELLLTGY
jgi:hypothetical protein